MHFAFSVYVVLIKINDDRLLSGDIIMRMLSGSKNTYLAPDTPYLQCSCMHDQIMHGQAMDAHLVTLRLKLVFH